MGCSISATVLVVVFVHSLSLCLFVCLFFAVLSVAFASLMIQTREGDGNFQVCIEIMTGTIADGLTVSIGYTLQDGASKNLYFKIRLNIFPPNCSLAT